jgi:transposase
MELGLPAVPAMGGQRRVRTAFQDIMRRSGFRIRADRRNHHPRPPARDGRKRGTQNQAIGRSRGGLTTKIVALVDALGNLARFTLLPGQRHDSVGVEPLLDGVAIGALIGDKGFDNDWLRRELDNRGALAVIPPKADRKTDIPCDFAMYRWRHLIENFFCAIKNFRRVATRYDKTDQSFTATIHLVAIALALK